MGKALRSLFRTLLRLSLKFDVNPSAKLLFYRKIVVPASSAQAAGTGAAQGQQQQQQQQALSTANAYYTNELIPLLFCDHDQAKLFHPKGQAGINLYRLVRQEFRRSRPSYASSDRLDAAFTAVRKLSSLWRSWSELKSDADDEEMNGHEWQDEAVQGDGTGSGRSWAAAASDSLLAPRSSPRPVKRPLLEVAPSSSLLPGVLVLAHPLVQGPLKRAVVLLLEHNTNGSYGLVLNRPTPHSLGSAVKNLPPHVLGGFGHLPVAFGGMVRRLQYLHSFPQVAGAAVPLSRGPLYAGGKMSEAVRLVQRDPLKARGFHFFVGCCTWGQGELSAELETGYWLPVCTQADEVVALARGTDTSTSGDWRGPSGVNPGPGPGPGPGQPNSHPNANAAANQGAGAGVDLWSLLVGRMGNSYRGALALPPWVDAGSVESLDV